MSSLYYDSADRPKSTPVNSEGVFLEGDCIVVPDGFVFPQVCVVTGEAVLDRPREYQFARTKYVDAADMSPGSMAVLLGGENRSHFGPKSKVSLCLNERLISRRRNLGIIAIVFAVLAVPLPLVIADRMDHGGWLILMPVFLIAAAVCKWRRDSMIKTRKVTPSFIWLAGVHPTVREQVYRSGQK